ncbi:hypothetical protein SAY86_014862 [Trapa natans]|uniref:Heparan-alpha-glucosaminide N-acetyltransferase catalytic domain-containing protein n=1 Tax=Trapa natans TaxID=22666 RepID=A0AAN7KIP6_TRANT|nr:hypothetical protein SAY86_014862 [Trapa natans]
MATTIDVEEDDEQIKVSLLSRISPVSLLQHGEPVVVAAHPEIVPSVSPDYQRTRSPSSNRRLASLDVFRGLTIALMILVDDAGGAFPSINHSPWFGVTLADFVMPFFLFGVGVSVGLVFKKISSKSLATQKVLLRTVKLFLLGLLLQGGYFHGRNNLTYGVDLGKIRWLGVLQRISIGYLLASISEIWLVNNLTVDSPMTFLKKYYIQWITSALLCAIYMAFVYGLYVPDWEYEVSSGNFSIYESSSKIVNCDTRGSIEPPCNAVGLIDRYLLGQSHLYQRPVYRRTKECSVNSPDYGPLPPNSPEWCLAPFDPEGLLSSLMATVTCFLGLHFGHILVHVESHSRRIHLWSTSSIILLTSGYMLYILGIPLCKPLYTLSYLCVTAGASGLLLTVIYYMVDVKDVKRPLLLLQWMGMNALVIFALAACELFPAALQGLYWRSPENNLVYFTERTVQAMLRSERWGTLVFVLLEIVFWGLLAGFLHMKNIYIRL